MMEQVQKRAILNDLEMLAVQELAQKGRKKFISSVRFSAQKLSSATIAILY
jgi:hypothetical protein